MKWFKHMSDLSRDEGVSSYLDDAGNDRVLAYGFLMFILEAIASRMDAAKGDVVCCATYSLRQWGRITYCHSNRVLKYLRMCEVIGWVQIGFEGSSCTVSAPRMLEWRDNYTARFEVTTDNVPQRRAEQIRTEQRESREEPSPSDCLTAKGARLSPPPDFKITEGLQEWAAKNCPSVDVSKETEKFLRHEFPSPRSNWDNQWKNWIQNGHEYQLRHNGSSAKPSRKDELLRLAKDLNMTRSCNEQESDFIERVERANEDRIDALNNL